jgi:hypothetical protein
VALENRQQRQDDAGTCQDGESDRDTSDTDADGIVAIDLDLKLAIDISLAMVGFLTTHIESLSRPEHQYREEVRATDKGNYERKPEDARLLSQSLREHRELCSVPFPDEESCQERNAEDKRYEHVCGAPWVLVSEKGVSDCVSGQKVKRRGGV